MEESKIITIGTGTQLVTNSLTLEQILDLAAVISIHNSEFKHACEVCKMRQRVLVAASPLVEKAFISCKCGKTPITLDELVNTTISSPVARYRLPNPIFVQLNRQGNAVSLAYYSYFNRMKGGVRFSRISDPSACTQFISMLYQELPSANFVILCDEDIIFREFGMFLCVKSINPGQEYNDCADKVAIISEDAILGERPDNQWE